MHHLESIFMELINDHGVLNEPSPKKGFERAPPEATWGAQGHLVWEDGQGEQAQSKVQHQHDKVFAQGYVYLITKFNINITRSQKNLDWVKSKFASLKANIHTQVNKSLLQQMFAATKCQHLFAATKYQQIFAATKFQQLFATAKLQQLLAATK